MLAEWHLYGSVSVSSIYDKLSAFSFVFLMNLQEENVLKHEIMTLI